MAPPSIKHAWNDSLKSYTYSIISTFSRALTHFCTMTIVIFLPGNSCISSTVSPCSGPPLTSSSSSSSSSQFSLLSDSMSWKCKHCSIWHINLLSTCTSNFKLISFGRAIMFLLKQYFQVLYALDYWHQPQWLTQSLGIHTLKECLGLTTAYWKQVGLYNFIFQFQLLV